MPRVVGWLVSLVGSAALASVLTLLLRWRGVLDDSAQPLGGVLAIAWCLLTGVVLATVVSARLRREAPVWEYGALAALAGVGAAAIVPLATGWTALNNDADIVTLALAFAWFGLLSGTALGFATIAPAFQRGLLTWIVWLWSGIVLGSLGFRWASVASVVSGYLVAILAVGILGYVAARRGERFAALAAIAGPAMQIAGLALYLTLFLSYGCPGSRGVCEPDFAGLVGLVVLSTYLCLVIGAGLTGATVGRHYATVDGD